MTLTLMAYGTLVSASIALMAWGADRWVRWAGRSRRFVWFGAMSAMVLILMAVAVRPRGVREIAVSAPRPATGVAAVPVLPPAGPAGDALAVAWLAGSALVMLSIVGGIIAMTRTRRRGRVVTWFGTPVVETDGVGPGAAPWGNPAIFVPAVLRALPDPQARLLLAHEREHVAAGDPRLLLSAACVVALMPWNVPLWWCFRRLRLAIECDCDARVLGQGAALGDYASLLLDLAAPRGHVLPALTPFVHSTTQLQTRIDAMTSRPVFPVSHRLATTLLLGLAAVAACETRMPPPVAPVADYVVKDGQAKPVMVAGTNRDSLRASLMEGLTIDADTSVLPLVVVRSASNAVLYSGRMAAKEALDAGVAPEDISSVEVIKARDVLPASARGGMIVIRLKDGATWKGPPSPRQGVEPASAGGSSRFGNVARKGLPWRPGA